MKKSNGKLGKKFETYRKFWTGQDMQRFYEAIDEQGGIEPLDF